MKLKIRKWYMYMGFAIASFVLAVLFFFWSIYYMSIAMVGTSFLTALAGFALLASSLQALRIAAYVYSVELGAKSDEESQS